MTTENNLSCAVTDSATWRSDLPPAGNQTSGDNGENGTSVSASHSSFELDYLGVAYIVIGLVGIVGNGVSCFVILSYKPLRIRLANYFLINQCFMDLLTSLLLLVHATVNLTHLHFTYVAGSVYCYLWKSRLLILGLMVSSTMSIVAVSIERYFEIVYPIRHRIAISRRIVVVSLVFTWIVGILFKMSTLLPFARYSNGECSVGVFPSTAVSTFVVVYNFLGEYFGPLCVISFCYIQMGRAFQAKIIGPTSSSVQVLTASKTVRVRKNIFKTLLTVVVCFVMTWTFKQFLSLVNGLGLARVDWNGSMYKFSVILQFSSCCLNPFIYMFQYEEFQRGLLRYTRRSRTQILPAIASTHMSAL